MEVRVGRAGESSGIEVNNQLVLEAAPGEDCIGHRGGPGYSGGGGYDAGDGGENGSDGEDGYGHGGDGSGFDLTSVNMDNFILSPGKAGSGLTFWGGGGGGVIVNGEKPTGEHSFTGEGYGGGGCFVDKGLPGCVLINM